MPYNNTNLMNQLYRQRENIENIINQYSQNIGQPPVQNIINTNSSSEIDVKYVKENEDIANIIITKKTLFIDEKNSKISIKDTDGTIIKSYDIIVPKDEKDLKIEQLENKILELEEKINVQSTKSDVANGDVKSTTTGTVKPIKSATVTTF